MYQGTLNTENEDYGYHDLGARIDPGQESAWGCLLHPDELRKIIFLGNGMLVTVNGQQLQDYQLKNWVDHAVRTLSARLQHDIYPRLFRHRPVMASDRREIEDYAEYDDVYMKEGTGRSAYTIQLRHLPVARIHKWEVRSVQNGQLVMDVLPRAVVNYAAGFLRSPVLTSPYGLSMPLPVVAYRMGQTNVPFAHCIDYSTGYEKASLVPRELVEVIINRMTIDVMSAYGDGIVGGLANSSVSVGVLSESIGTTMSATSAYFGARIVEKQKWESDWFKQRAPYYTGIRMRAL